MYERTFAESLNLHLRCPSMVLGEFYMIPVYSYDDALANQKELDLDQIVASNLILKNTSNRLGQSIIELL